MRISFLRMHSNAFSFLRMQRTAFWECILILENAFAFSKGGALLNLLCEIAVELTYENFCQGARRRWGAAYCDGCRVPLSLFARAPFHTYTHVYTPNTPANFAHTRAYTPKLPFINVTWLLHTCDMTLSYMWHDSFIHVTWLLHTCDMTPSYMWHDSFIHVTW